MHLMSTKLERAKLASLETISANIHVIPSSTLRSHSRWSPIRRYGLGVVFSNICLDMSAGKSHLHQPSRIF